jgi:hypothetical protein
MPWATATGARTARGAGTVVSSGESSPRSRSSLGSKQAGCRDVAVSSRPGRLVHTARGHPHGVGGQRFVLPPSGYRHGARWWGDTTKSLSLVSRQTPSAASRRRASNNLNRRDRVAFGPTGGWLCLQGGGCGFESHRLHGSKYQVDPHFRQPARPNEEALGRCGEHSGEQLDSSCGPVDRTRRGSARHHTTRCRPRHSMQPMAGPLALLRRVQRLLGLLSLQLCPSCQP